MTEKEYVLERKSEFREAALNVDKWKKLVGSAEWQQVIRYLEQRYVEVADKFDTDSVKGLAGRNARLDEIRKLFQYIQHDFNASATRLRQLMDDRELIDEETPTPFIPY